MQVHVVMLSLISLSCPIILLTSLACRSCPDLMSLRTKHQTFQYADAITVALL
ncbi:hypothetical protein K450DRAFT_253433 [Umbelopsis ramanniana AG]|uniref:Uncharacterized protein n=1 Tax=Umbelopsis ramanniana AG TaxID=1314678 RepID=A0AAD5E456_UMBRA|nr:uncharacterized protein K450DRAFT_253433 [Umbelopsis ramanniana AG]KAI8577213.1 hypothetical protein K450DRAFT_253433 [Umbelopsis ramanniana AG]